MDDFEKMTGKATVRLAVSAESVGSTQAEQALARGAEILRSGGTVAFPTETVYGLGANALDPAAVERIFIAKQRPAWDPLIVHISDLAMLERVCAGISARAQKLMDAFWPGPLTLLLPRLASLPDAVTAGRALVGVRMPAHPVARALIRASDAPVAAPSANRFGHTSPTTAEHVLEDLSGRIDMVLDAGPTWCGVESTVIGLADESIILYRPGAVTAEELEAVAGPVALYQLTRALIPPQALPSPGLGMRHYAPDAVVIPVDVGAGAEDEQRARWMSAVQAGCSRPNCVGVMLPSDWPLPENFSGVRFAWGRWGDDRELARRLFAGLRALDGMGATIVFCPLPRDSGIGAAILDRISKAARAE